MIVERNQSYRLYLYSTLLCGLMFTGNSAFSQQSATSRYSANDTVIVPFIVYQGDTISAREMEVCYVTAQAPLAMKNRLREWTRLRNAVYVTYPYAKRAGNIMNDINAKLVNIKQPEQRRAYIKSREKDLKKEFTEPLTNLSIYQGKILMKLINRQTGNNCYEIIKEYKGGLTARLYQTVAFVFSTSLKQPYDAKGEDQQIELIVKEVERMYSH